MAAAVVALQAMRVALAVAVRVVAEVGDFHRFAKCPAVDGLSRPGAQRAFIRGPHPSRGITKASSPLT